MINRSEIIKQIRKLQKELNIDNECFVMRLETDIEVENRLNELLKIKIDKL